MKFLILCTLFFSTLTLAETRFECSSDKGDIIVTFNENQPSVIDFTRYTGANSHALSTAYFDLVKEPLKNAMDGKLTISEKLLADQSTFQKTMGGFKFKNDDRVLIANASNSSGWEDSSIKFKLKKKEGIATLKYKAKAFFQTSYKLNDSFNCVKF
ncbi:hypothetical protein ACJVC5_04040 [Peredibacter sp. HCB2-198]|uniref:hypothetical protein n=1 Tax=Peredibacter sp. HCB2-198 TaxID=3383025 RepID=UPI0038B50D36